MTWYSLFDHCCHDSMAAQEHYDLKKLQMYQLSVVEKKEGTGRAYKIVIDQNWNLTKKKYRNICGDKISKRILEYGIYSSYGYIYYI